ncbi:hypothetical protein C453_00380 [Haloferax elongans ATCC BAA-1513]|uniref:Uncharacterized protein n=1 Tax=Haloferax elongans ATCC BAA-1513 TaxID=1230453 RepID=M0HYB2_HALEO|nr:hypothetical protein [Haloferax elongans]ELZ89486.1 hypothetical protein C453_00380 [Haloferax elongans ATCC BAA-1513]
MSDNNDSSSSFSRRNILKSAAGGAAGLSGLSQVPVAWAQPTESELDELEAKPNVQAVLSELGLDSLPDDMQKLSNSFGDGEDVVEFEIWEGELSYGTLHVGQLDDLTNVVVEFSTDFRATAPRRYRSIPDGTEPLVSASEGEAFVKRSPTEGEKRAISDLLPESGSMVAYTATNQEGFQVNLVRYNESKNELEQQQFRAPVDTKNGVHPVFKESTGALRNASLNKVIQPKGIIDGATEVVQDVAKGIQNGYFDWDGDLGDARWHLENTHKPWKKIPDDVKNIDNLGKGAIKSIIIAEAAEEGAEELFGQCGEPCSDCAMTASDILLNCHKCRFFLGAGISSTGPAGLVLFVVCVWSFCNFPGAINKCSTCIDCYTK